MNMFVVLSVMCVHIYAAERCLNGLCKCCRTGACFNSPNEPSACNGCIDGYTGPNCHEPCPQNCVNCSQTYFESDRTCDVCQSGYYNGKFKDIQSHSARTDCTLKCKENCKQCSSYQHCIKCEDGYVFSANKDCVSCPVNCKSCTSQVSCNECNDGYFWSDNLCQRCDPSCNSCSSFNMCSECCFDNNLKNYMCKKCNSGCLSCDAQNVCTSCLTGYALNGSHCTECGQHCSECTLDTLQQFSCIACTDGYYLSNNICSKCRKGCKLCHSDNTCQKCDDEYILQKGICIICHSSCIECSSDNLCLSCKSGSYSDGVECHPCNTPCITCESAQVCLTCNDGFYGDDCAKVCPRNCNNNICSHQDGKCISCTQGYYFDDSKNCISCPEHCLTCQNKSSCNICLSGYMGTSCQKECPNCKPGTECNKTIGFCIDSCRDGLSGNYCDINCSTTCLACDRDNPIMCKTCPAHMFGSSCSEPCSESCLSNICNDENGSCTYKCVNGYWGLRCENNCSEHCRDQVCERNDGICLLGCLNIYTGSKCLCPRNCECDDIGTCVSCKEGFGDICENTCSEGCVRKLCHRTTGECLAGCKEGLNGSYCIQVLKGLKEEGNESLQLKVSVVGLVLGPLGILTVILGGLGFFMYKKRNSAFVTRARDAVAVLSMRFSDMLQWCRDRRPDSSLDQVQDENLEELDLDDSYDNLETVYSALYSAEEERYYSTLSLSKSKVRLHSLEEYVIKKTHRDFIGEFQQLPSHLTRSYTESQKKENLKKNRYRGIYPYDSTLVTINSTTSDYINASYIDGYKKSKAYIASIGPTTQYMGDMSVFWRMVWQEKSGKIVMLTNIDEPQAYSCDRYWPENEYSCMFDNITVSSKGEEQFASYIVRTLEVQIQSEKRQVTQFHFTAWQEKHLPTNAGQLVEFQQNVNRCKPETDGPLIVHCSAGVGRTGTYIALDMLMQEMEAEGHVDIFGCVKNLREQRVKMVQTLEQYKFIHHALCCSQTVYTHLENRRLSGMHVYDDCTEAPDTYSPLLIKESATILEV